MKGADRGPDSIFEASAHLELYDIGTGSEVYRHGIYTDGPVDEKSSPERMIEAVRNRVLQHLEENRFTVTVGGEHAVSIGAVKAHRKIYKSLCVLRLDAHADLRNKYGGSKYNHACVAARFREICPLVQVGIRSLDKTEKDLVEENRTFYAENIFRDGSWHDKAVGELLDDVYISIDLDVFDPSIIPSTGTPEPGGLLWYDILDFLWKVCSERNVVGFDVVELCPNPEVKAPDFLAAKLIYRLLSIIHGRE